MVSFRCPLPPPVVPELLILGSYKEALPPSPLGLHHTSRDPPPLPPLLLRALAIFVSPKAAASNLPFPVLLIPETPGMGSSHLPLTPELLTARPDEPQCHLDHIRHVHRVVDSVHTKFCRKNRSEQTNCMSFCGKTLKLSENQPVATNFLDSLFTLSPFPKIKS
jgi:hypothetical protein